MSFSLPQVDTEFSVDSTQHWSQTDELEPLKFFQNLANSKNRSSEVQKSTVEHVAQILKNLGAVTHQVPVFSSGLQETQTSVWYPTSLASICAAQQVRQLLDDNTNLGQVQSFRQSPVLDVVMSYLAPLTQSKPVVVAGKTNQTNWHRLCTASEYETAAWFDIVKNKPQVPVVNLTLQFKADPLHSTASAVVLDFCGAVQPRHCQAVVESLCRVNSTLEQLWNAPHAEQRQAAATQLGQLLGDRCVVCNRKLTASAQFGLGPHCRKLVKRSSTVSSLINMIVK